MMSVFRRGATGLNNSIEYDAFPGLAESKGTEPRFRNIQPIRKQYQHRNSIHIFTPNQRLSNLFYPPLLEFVKAIIASH